MKAASRVEIVHGAVTEPAAGTAVGAETENAIPVLVAVGNVAGVAVTEAAVGAMIRVDAIPAESASAAETTQSAALVILNLRTYSVRKDRALRELRVWYRSKSTTLLIEPLSVS